MGEPVDYDALRSAFFGPSGQPAPAPRDPATLDARARRVLDPRRAAHGERLSPALVRLLHPAAAARVRGRRGARAGRPAGHRRLARRPDRRVRRGGGAALAVRPRRLRRGQLRDPDLGRGHGELHRDGDRPRRAPARASAVRRPPAAAPSRASACTRRTRRTSRSAGRSTSSASRPRRSRSCRPTTTSGSGRRRSRTRSGATGPRGSCRSRSPRSRARRTPAPSTRSASSPTWRDREGLWLHVDAAYGAAARLSARDARRVPDLERAQSVTVDPHKWLFQAYDIGGLMVRERAVLGEAFGGRRPEYYRAGHERERHRRNRRLRPRGERGRRRRPRLGGPAQLLAPRVRGHAALARAQAVAVLEARRIRGLRAAGRGERRPRRPPRGANRRVRRLRGPAGRSAAVRRVLPPPARRAAGAAPGRRRPRSTRTRIGCRPRSRRAARAGSRRPGCAARRTFGQGSSTRNRPSMTSMTCSSCSGASLAMPDRRSRRATTANRARVAAARWHRGLAAAVPRSVLAAVPGPPAPASASGEGVALLAPPPETCRPARRGRRATSGHLPWAPVAAVVGPRRAPADRRDRWSWAASSLLIAAFVVLRRTSAPLVPADPGEWWTCRNCGGRTSSAAPAATPAARGSASDSHRPASSSRSRSSWPRRQT